MMTTMREYRCEGCGIVDTRPIHWFVIRCGDSQPSVHRWNSEAAQAGGAGSKEGFRKQPVVNRFAKGRSNAQGVEPRTSETPS
jgi:hypothetical protein